MNITFDPDNRSLYLKLKAGESVESAEVVPGIVFDYDADGVVVGIDIDDVDEAVGIDTLKRSA
jgi:uncharacterized protein YuzE